MTEADRVFAGIKGRAGQSTGSEQRIIQRRSRQGGVSRSQTRVVEVVHVRHAAKRPVNDQPFLSEAAVGPDAWSDDVDTVTTSHMLDLIPAPAAEPQQPVVHVMPTWEPRAAEVPLAASTDDMPTQAPVPAKRTRRTKTGSKPDAAARRYADPFANDDSGTNCLRCGYLVEPTRERGGWLTCARCG
jgi:type IV secretory pathway VirB10-like protein